MDRRFDTAVAVGFMIAGLAIIWQASLIRTGINRDLIGPRAAFYVCGAIMVLGGMIIVLRHWRAGGAGARLIVMDEGTGDTPGYPAHFRRAAALVAVCLAYGMLFEPLGYLLATPLFIIAALAVLNQRRWRVNAAIALIFTILAYLVFAKVLGVRMPHGPLTPLFRELGWITL